ncbi:MAG: hypothetical protein K5778_04260 [Bacteroidaceae bacterium]|nr:hypothetical protein [Bacteroidaceae bacterium]
MKQYIQPTIETEILSAWNTYMLTASDEEGEIGGSGGAGDAKLRDEDELEEQQSNAWNDGLW